MKHRSYILTHLHVSLTAISIYFSHCRNGRLGQDLGFGGFAFALKLPKLLNTNLPTVRAKLGQTSSFPDGPKFGNQPWPMSITKLSPNWACQMGPLHCPKFLLSAYASGDDAETAKTGNRVKSQSYVRARPKTLER